MNKRNLLSILSFSLIVLFGTSCATVSNREGGVDKTNSSETEPLGATLAGPVNIKISNALRETIQYGDSAMGPWKDLAPSSSYTKEGDQKNPGLNITFIEFKTSRGSGNIWGMNGNVGYPSVTMEIPGQGFWSTGYFSEGETKSQKAGNWTYTVTRHSDVSRAWYESPIKNFELTIADTTPYHKLTVSDVDQFKNGTISSAPAGIDCGSTCEASFASATSVTLTATPRPGYFLSGSSWTGCDSIGADGTTCTVAIKDKDRNVSVKFERSNDNTLTVSKQGCGKVIGAGGAINCGTACSANFLTGDSVTLTAEAGSSCVLSGWSGCDSTGADGTTCNVTINSKNRNVSAKFERPTGNTLTVTKMGCGKVTSVGGEIACGTGRTTCSAKFLPNELVTLTAETSSHCVLTKWSGCDSTTGRLCEVLLNSDRDVGATFRNLDR